MNEESNNNSSEFDWHSYRKLLHTYKWKFYHRKNKWHYEFDEPYLYEKGEELENEKKEDFSEWILYRTPDKPPYDEHIRHHNWLLALKEKYFNVVLEDYSQLYGRSPRIQFTLIEIPGKKRKEIEGTIEEYGLELIQDLLVEVIAIAQQYYIDDVFEWDYPQGKKDIKTAKKQANEVIKAIEWSGAGRRFNLKESDNPRRELDHIKFVFNPGGTIKIDHGWLKHDVLKRMVDHYNEVGFRDWRKNLKAYPSRIRKYESRLKFKERLAKAYHRLFVDLNILGVEDGRQTPNRMMKCIAKLLEFSLIPIIQEGGMEEDKARHIRNWVNRNELERLPHSIQIPVNLSRLNNYFKSDLLKMANEEKPIDVVASAEHICHRFDIEYLLEDLTHFISCIKASVWLRRNQVSERTVFGKEQSPEFNAFRELMNGISSNKQISEVVFTFADEKDQHIINSRLPLFLIENAIRYYYEKYNVDWDIDLLATDLKSKSGQEIIVEQGMEFNLPHSRFQVQLVHSLFSYLKAESKVEVAEHRKADRFYEIIAVILFHSDVFNSNNLSESEAIDLVRNWHSLTANS